MKLKPETYNTKTNFIIIYFLAPNDFAKRPKFLKIRALITACVTGTLFLFDFTLPRSIARKED